jgi:hypothetical protein
MFLDQWMSPIKMRIKYKTDHPDNLSDIAIMLWSFGPNRKNENGLGDDITHIQEWKSLTK